MKNGDFAEGKIYRYEPFQVIENDGVLYVYARYKAEPDDWTAYGLYQITNSTIESYSIINGLPVELDDADVNILKKYMDEPIVNLVLSKYEDNIVILSEDEYDDFYEWLTDASVFTLDIEDEPTDDTYAIEGIIDYLYSVHG